METPQDQPGKRETGNRWFRFLPWAVLFFSWGGFWLLLVVLQRPDDARASASSVQNVTDGWKMKTGDDPAWAGNAFDPSGWPSGDIAKAWGSTDFDGFSWQSREIRLPADAFDPVRRNFIGLQIGTLYYGCYRVFVNGEEIAAAGSFAPLKSTAVIPAAVYPVPSRLIGPDGRVRVALRVWKDPGRSRVAAYFARQLGGRQGEFAVGLFPVLRDGLEADRRDLLVAHIDRLVLSFLYALACHYFFQMYLARRESPEYLWLAGIIVCLFFNTITNSVWAVEFAPPVAVNVARVSSRQFVGVFIIQFMADFLRRSIAWPMKTVQLLVLSWGVAVVVSPNLSASPLDNYMFLLIVPVVFYFLLQIGGEAVRGNEEAKPFLVGLSVILVFEALTAARIFGWIQMPLIAHWGISWLAIAMTYAISNRFNRVYDGLDHLNHELEAKVAERNEELGRANNQLAGTVRQLEEARAVMVRKNEELDRRVAEINGKNLELVETQRQADRIFSALALALPGTVLDEKYRLDEKIGEGGFGVVFKATHLSLGRAMAVKVFKPRPGNDNAEAVERFKREGISISRLSHPNIITVLDSGISAQGIAYLVMELLKGVSLAQELRSVPATTLKHCLERVIPVCGALAEAHRLGIIHRDIKPDNIFINYTLEGEVIKVVDFGIAKMMADDTGENLETLTGTNHLIGTPTYMAPERLASKPYDGGSDVYSLGVVLYELLAGRPPFEKTLSGLVGMMLKHIKDVPTPLRELNPFIPASIEAIVARTLDKDPARRPSALELGELLSDVLKTLPPEILTQGFDRLSPMEAFVSTRFSESSGA